MISWIGPLLLAVVLLPLPARAGDLDADAIMQRSFRVTKVADSRGEVAMTLIAPNGGRRERTMLSLSKLQENGVDEKRLIRFLSPADVKGTATLSVQHAGEDDIWVYLPGLHKVRRLVAANKKDSYVGTDFSYGDVVGHRPEDWTHVLEGKEPVDGVETYVIVATPRTDAVRDDSGYGKVKVWVRTTDFVAARAQYFDAAGTLVKELEASDVRPMDAAAGKYQPFHMVMHNRQSGHATEIVWKSVQVGLGLGDDQFTERQLEKES